MKRVEGVDADNATFTEELDGATIKATVHALLTAEFTLAIAKHSSGFKADKLFEEYPTIFPPY